MTKSNHIFNLVKYDLKFIYKQLIVFYIIIFTSSIIARLTNFENSSFIIRFLHEFFQGATLGFSLGALINGSIRLWARFRYNIYGDESYLTHTLPISRGALWASKFLTSIVMNIASIIVITVSIYILFPSEVITGMINTWNINGLTINFWAFITMFVFMLLCQLIFIMQAGYTGILLGHRANNRRLLLSNAIGIATYLIGGIIILGVCYFLSIFTPDVHQVLFESAFGISEQTLFNIMAIISVSYITLTAVTYLINYRLLASGVNVD